MPGNERRPEAVVIPSVAPVVVRVPGTYRGRAEGPTRWIDLDLTKAPPFPLRLRLEPVEGEFFMRDGDGFEYTIGTLPKKKT